jgi:putative tricarboxylic transport membrane protein
MLSARARTVAAVLGWLLAAACGSQAIAQSELKLMAPAAPGGGWDQTARSLQQALLQSKLSRSVQVTNVNGAGGTVGLAQFVNGAKGDGSQLMVNGLVMVGAILTNRSPVQLDQATPIARLTSEWLIIVVPVNSPLKTVADLAEQSRADPGKVRFAGGSAGGVDHIAAGLFTKTVGGDPKRMNYIPFSGGGESLAAIIGGRVTAGISGYGEYESQIKAGKLRALAVTSPTRLDGLDAPTLKESGVDLEIQNWRSVFAPPGLSDPDRAKLVELMTRLVRTEEWLGILKQKGWDDAFLPGDRFAEFLKSEQTRVRDVLTSIGLVKG